MEKANSMVLLDMCDMNGWRWHGPQSAQLGSSQVRMCGNQDASSVPSHSVLLGSDRQFLVTEKVPYDFLYAGNYELWLAR